MIHVSPIDEFTATPRSERRALEYWNELVCGTFTGLVVDAPDPASFAASMRRVSFGELVLATPRASASIVRHTPEHVRMAQHDAFLLHVQTTGVSLNEQAGRRALLGAGDLTLCTTSAPYALHLHEQCEHLVVRLPGAALRSRLPHPEDFVSLRIPGDQGVGAIAVGYLRSLWGELSVGNLSAVDSELADVVLDLVAVACRRSGVEQLEQHSRRATRQQRLLAYVHSRIRDPNLSVASVAQALGMSVRNVCKLMSRDGQGLAAYILEQRLAGCARWLSDPTRAHLRVSDIAYEWGFGDLSHFSRSFSRHYGESPRSFREATRNPQHH